MYQTNMTDQLVSKNVLPTHRDLYYGGAWHEPVSGVYRDNTNPATGESLGRFAVAGPDDVDRAVRAAHAGFLEWRKLKPRERARILKAVAERIRLNTDELGLIDAIDGGFAYYSMRHEAAEAAEVIEYFAGLYTEMKGETIPMGEDVLNYVIREPFGVVARINAFNHPIMFAGMRLAAPLIAGNTIIIKPAEQAPLSVLRLAELIHDLLPPGVFNVLNGGRDTGQALVEHPLVPRVAVIGSIATGRAVLQAAANGIKRVTLELGGKNPFIVYPDADPTKVAAAAVRGMSLGRGCGQACSSNTRLFFHEDIHDQVVDAIAEQLKAIKLGDPADPETEMGCLVSKQQQQRVLEYIRSGIEDGARLVVGGKVPEGPLARGAYVEPTLFTDVRPDMRIAREEIFGPVMSVLRWSDEDTLFAAVNSIEYALAASVWTKDLARAHRAAARIDAGYVWINNTLAHLLGAPFGGHRASGLGVEECLEELLSYTQLKNVNVVLAP